jgi:hypothetical protein
MTDVREKVQNERKPFSINALMTVGRFLFIMLHINHESRMNQKTTKYKYSESIE